MGNENFQISGNIEERQLSTTPDISEDDVKTVMEQANVSEEKAKKQLKKPMAIQQKQLWVLTKKSSILTKLFYT